jgi:hypothetical protein
MSEDEAYQRVAAARLVHRFPVALGMIERGEIHLTGLLMLRDHLTAEGGEQLLHAAAGKSKSKTELQHLLAELFPRPDVPASIQSLTDSMACPGLAGHGARGTVMSSGARPPRSRIEPLAPARYRLEFTASAELKEKLERAANLMRQTNPSGELSVLVERALDLLLAKLEKQRLAKAIRPRDGALRPSTRRGYVPRAVRREVFERDGERCTFVDPSGRRCESLTWLELDHRVPRALRGADDVSNLSVRCRAHNRLSAEEQFGREHMDGKAGKCHAGGKTAGEKTIGATETTGEKTIGATKATGEKAIGATKARGEKAIGATETTGEKTIDATETTGEKAIGATEARGEKTIGATEATGEKTIGATKATGERIAGKKTLGEKGPAGGAAAAQGGAGAQGGSTADPCSRSQNASETTATPTAAPVAADGCLRQRGRAAGDGCPRQRGRDEDDRQHACDNLAFRALCGMGFRAQEARRALGSVRRRSAESPPAAIETLLREALAVLAR